MKSNSLDQHGYVSTEMEIVRLESWLAKNASRLAIKTLSISKRSRLSVLQSQARHAQATLASSVMPSL